MLFSLTLTDCLILGIVIVLIILISYFSVYKKKDDPCKGCPYAKNGCSQKDCNSFKDVDN